MRKITALLFALLISLPLAAEGDSDVLFRREVGGGLGMGFCTNDASPKFFGDMGFGGNALLRFNINKRMAVKTMLSYVTAKGDARNREDFVPDNPNITGTQTSDYSFSGGIADLSVLYELHFLPYGYIRDYRGMKRFTPYVQLGLGMTYATPGKAFTANIPIGAGLKWKAGKRLNVGLDWTFHFTMNDKIDGLEAPHGIKSTMFKNKDHYSQMFLTLSYDISPRCADCHKDD